MKKVKIVDAKDIVNAVKYPNVTDYRINLYKNEKYKENVTKALDKVQKNAKTRLVTFEILVDLCYVAERKFHEYDIPLKYREKTRIIYDENDTPKSYKYWVSTTRVCLERTKSGWYLVEAVREEQSPGEPSTRYIVLPKEAKQRIVAQMLKEYCNIKW